MFVELLVRVAAQLPDGVNYDDAYIEVESPINIMLDGEKVGYSFEHETMEVVNV